ncbi:MAG: hypothetical protein ACJAR5_000383 [Pseudophaeobacter arcticus]|jgi:hypothetical protein
MFIQMMTVLRSPAPCPQIVRSLAAACPACAFRASGEDIRSPDLLNKNITSDTRFTSFYRPSPYPST